jgi:hypothetical protein
VAKDEVLARAGADRIGLHEAEAADRVRQRRGRDSVFARANARRRRESRTGRRASAIGHEGDGAMALPARDRRRTAVSRARDEVVLVPAVADVEGDRRAAARAAGEAFAVA